MYIVQGNVCLFLFDYILVDILVGTTTIRLEVFGFEIFELGKRRFIALPLELQWPRYYNVLCGPEKVGKILRYLNTFRRIAVIMLIIQTV